MSNKVIRIPEQYRPAIADLPGDLQRIAEHIEEHRPGHGVDLTLFLAQVFRGQSLYIRNIDHIVRQIRDDAIRAAYDRGEKIKDIALFWGLSERMVEKILTRPSASDDSRQMKLFPLPSGEGQG